MALLALNPKFARGLAALTLLVPLVSLAGSSGSLLLVGRVASHQRTRVEPRLERFSPQLAASSEGTELAHIIHQTNSGEGFTLLVSDSSGGTLSLDGKDVPYSVELERAHPVRPGRVSSVLRTEPGSLRPSRYDYSLRLRIDGAREFHSRAASRSPASSQTLTLSIIAL